MRKQPAFGLPAGVHNTKTVGPAIARLASMDRCHGCGAELEGGRVLHRSRVYCSLACALDHYDTELIRERERRLVATAPEPAKQLAL